ncbi:Purple acid phosphatase 10 isoform 2 [Theobroma cacao]|uniref:Purple acid phosphatase 10 isoform 2 n=1 Tax=Theobroma cacao TaxID=3641 RepID=A0A061FD96_THECC|nr:Purple acid phosphatase 10 isoform 2 [Theobroma cacao]
MALLKAFDPFVICLLCLILSASDFCNGGITSSFVRKEYSPDMPLDSDVFQVPPGYNEPQQVHITQGDADGRGVIISWITPDEPGSNTVLYWSENSKHKNRADGTFVRYKFFNYTSGYIHHCTINKLEGETTPFKPYTHRYYVPYESSHSTSPLWYSIKRASAYVIVLSSYSAYGKSTPQYKWLSDELPKVDRSETPWLILLMHCPIYNSNSHHYMEGESMRVVYESWFVKYKVDVVFAGHVHAYERSKRVSNIAYNIVNGMCTPVNDQSAPVYITIGDGGNHDGPAIGMVEPQPSFSAYREASFGHGIFDVKNRTHACFSWHRNQDGRATEADSLWFHNRYWNPLGKSFVASY